MRTLSDSAIARLRETIERPHMSGTRYRVIDEIGRGGMGIVWRAEDLTLDREVAVKVLSAVPGGDDAGARFAREAKIIARLDHPGIVPIHDAGELSDGRVFYVMKLVRGARVDEWIEGAPAVAERLRLFEKVCDAVGFAHAHGVVHRDLKPQNVMVGAFGEVFVMDWGVAKLLDSGPSDERSTGAGGDGDTRDGVAVGTRGYMAPEQERGDAASVDSRADVYALGGLLRFLLTGRHPDQSDGEPLPRALAAVVDKATARDPESRYATVVELSVEVSRWLDGLRVEAHRESVVDRVGRWTRKYRVAIAVVGAYLVMRVILIVLFGR